MNWDPAMLEPSNLEWWRLAIIWLFGLPLIFISFCALALTGVISVDMTEFALRHEIETAGPIKRLLLTFIAGPLLAIATQVMLCLGLYAIVCGAWGDSNKHRN